MHAFAKVADVEHVLIIIERFVKERNDWYRYKNGQRVNDKVKKTRRTMRI